MRETEKTQIGYVNPCKISSKNPPFFFAKVNSGKKKMRRDIGDV